METLRQKGFFGRLLVPITTPLLVERYNDCLRSLGKEETKLDRFSVDGAGWSPQIAKEKNDPDYLCHGEANLYAIILTPNQRGKPIYAPMHSFDASILQTIHDIHSKAISNLTSRSAIILDIDQGIDSYRTPMDLLMVDEFTVKAFTPCAVMDGANRQKELVARFRKEPGAWQDPQLIESLVKSAEDWGDLRHSALQIAPTAYTDIDNFYTRALGGLYVFRDFLGQPCKLLVLSEDVENGESLPHRDMYVLPHDWEKVLGRLVQLGFLEPKLSDVSKSLKASMERTQHEMLAHTAYEQGLEENIDKINSGQLANWRRKASEHLPKAYQGLQKQLDVFNGKDASFDAIDFQTWVHLLKPKDALGESTQHVLWHLLSRVQPFHIEIAYRHNKPLFYKRYESWKVPQREWALDYLNRLGLPHHE